MMMPTLLFFLIGCATVQTAIGLTSEELQVFSDSGKFVITTRPIVYLFESTGLPDHEYGPFPSKGNPNEVAEQDYTFRIPKTVTYSEDGFCLAMGPIGVTVNGVPLYNPYTSVGTNAVENERFDDCDGHPDGNDRYHYHQIPDCVYNATLGNQLVGVAKDGYPIYGEVDASGVTVTSSDLDDCHGRWETDAATGQQVYRYRLTRDFPYVLGCYRGVPSKIGGNHCLFTSVAGENPIDSGYWD